MITINAMIEVRNLRKFAQFFQEKKHNDLNIFQKGLKYLIKKDERIEKVRPIINNEFIKLWFIKDIIDKIIIKQGIPVKIKKFSIDDYTENRESSHMLKCEIMLEELDYNQVIEFIVPKLMHGMADKDNKLGKLTTLLKDMDHMTEDMIKAAMNVIPQEIKNELLVNIIAIYNDEILQNLNKLILDKMQIPECIHGIKVEN